MFFASSADDDDDLFYVRQVAAARLLIFFIIFFVIGEGLRWLARNNARPKHQPLVLDLVATFTLYGYTVGCNYVHRIYGPTWYLVATASVGIGHAHLLCPGVTANPITHVASCIACETPIQRLLLRFGVHVTGSMVCHPIATLLWQTLMTDIGGQGLDPEMHCMGQCEEGRPVQVAMVLALELLGTMVVSLMMMKTCHLSIDFYETIVKVFIGCMLRGLGFNMPAIYLNPVLANAQLLGCSHQDLIERVMVYWIGPLVGVSVAVFSTFRCQEGQRRLCRPCVTFDECPSAECKQPERPSDADSRCQLCESKSRSNSSRPCRCSNLENDEVDEESCEDAEPSACRPNGCGITAQVKQTSVNGSKQLAYLFDIPPTVCRKGLRLRHNILVTNQPKCESDICRDSSWRDATTGRWGSCSPSPSPPMCRDTSSPDCPSDDWRRPSYFARERSRSPSPEPDCMRQSLGLSRTQSGLGCVKRSQHRSSSRIEPRRPSVQRSSQNRQSVRRSSGGRRSSPRASASRESDRRRHSRRPTVDRKSYQGASRQSRVGARETRASGVATRRSRPTDPGNSRSVDNSKPMAKTRLGKRSTA